MLLSKEDNRACRLNLEPVMNECNNSKAQEKFTSQTQVVSAHRERYMNKRPKTQPILYDNPIRGCPHPCPKLQVLHFVADGC